MVAPAPLTLPSGAGEFDAVVDGTDRLRRSVLPSGVRVLTQRTPGAHSATVGFWVPVGSRDEVAGEFGSTHFLEHLLFKGTTTRSALDLAVGFDEVGADSNAVTAKEYTCYYARCRAEDVPRSVRLMSDMVMSSTIPADQFDPEREVILEELAAAVDDPGDVVQERFAQALFGDSGLGRPIGGTPQTIQAATRDGVLSHYHRHYRAGNLVVAAAGAVDHDRICELVQAACEAAGWEAPEGPAPRPSIAPSAAGATPIPVDVLVRDSEQVNLILGGRALRASDPDRFALSVWSTLFGGGVSSRMFQELREKRGLVYTAYSFASLYRDAGLFGLFAATRPSKAPTVAALLRELAHDFAATGPSAEEVALATGQMVGAMTLALEDTHARMARLGRAEIGSGVLYDLPASVAAVRAVTAADVARVASGILDAPLSLCSVGPVSAERLGTAVD